MCEESSLDVEVMAPCWEIACEIAVYCCSCYIIRSPVQSLHSKTTVHLCGFIHCSDNQSLTPYKLNPRWPKFGPREVSHSQYVKAGITALVGDICAFITAEMSLFSVLETLGSQISSNVYLIDCTDCWNWFDFATRINIDVARLFPTSHKTNRLYFWSSFISEMWWKADKMMFDHLKRGQHEGMIG